MQTKKNVPLKISIPKPCDQLWDELPELGGGRYCGVCTQVVYDFSQMSDNELFHYFQLAKTKTCGKFHPHQLNVNILPLEKKHVFGGKIKKLAAAVATFVSLETASAQASQPLVKNDSLAHIYEKGLPPSKKIVISGVVKKGTSGVLENAKIGLDTIASTYTKADGSFSFELEENQKVPHVLYFSFGNLERVVRTYHPAMGSTFYEVTFPDPEVYVYYSGTMGAPMISLEESFPEIVFEKNSYFLEEDIKMALEITAAKMKSNPHLNIKFEGYGISEKHQKLINKQFVQIKKFLTHHLGIDEARIKTLITPVKYVNVIDILQAD